MNGSATMTAPNGDTSGRSPAGTGRRFLHTSGSGTGWGAGDYVVTLTTQTTGSARSSPASSDSNFVGVEPGGRIESMGSSASTEYCAFTKAVEHLGVGGAS